MRASVTLRGSAGAARLAALALLALSCGLCAALAGCQTPPKDPQPNEEFDPRKIPPRDDIREIACFWPAPVWQTDAGKAVGLQFTAYFVSGSTHRGAFVPGLVRVKLFVVEPGPDGALKRGLAYTWELDEQHAMKFRVIRRTIMGFAYSFRLRWPADLDVSGKRVEIGVEYVPQEGRVVNYGPQPDRVPYGSYEPRRPVPPRTSRPAGTS
jgi:hypothetical protein